MGHGYCRVHHEQKRKEARQVHKRSVVAQKAIDLKGRVLAWKCYVEKALMKKTFVASHINNRDQEFCTANSKGPIPGCIPGYCCKYQLAYGDGSSSAGYFMRDITQYDRVSGNLQVAQANSFVVLGSIKGENWSSFSVSLAISWLFCFYWFTFYWSEEVENLPIKENKLDYQIREMQERLMSFTEDEHNQKWIFVTEDDIKTLPCFQNETLIAIKAPHGTTLEVPDPDEVERNI